MDRDMDEDDRGTVALFREHEVSIPPSQNIRLAGTLSAAIRRAASAIRSFGVPPCAHAAESRATTTPST
jgi:hypothetical protein